MRKLAYFTPTICLVKITLQQKKTGICHLSPIIQNKNKQKTKTNKKQNT